MKRVPVRDREAAVLSISSTGLIPGVQETLHLPSERTTMTGWNPPFALSLRISCPLISPWVRGVRPPVGISWSTWYAFRVLFVSGSISSQRSMRNTAIPILSLFW